MNKYALSSFALLFAATCAYAEGIDETHRNAWSENGGWIAFRFTGSTVAVTGTGMTGYAWSENYGWINLSPEQSGVANDGNGHLSGYAWGEQTGWINFGGVTIDSEGYFHGYATNDVLGRISFNCTNGNSCGTSNFKLQTEWLAPASSAGSSSSAATSAAERGGGGGGGRRGSPGRGGAVAAPMRTGRQAVPAAARKPAESPLMPARTCERVMKWFRGNAKMLGRVNARLEKRFGFTCAE